MAGILALDVSGNTNVVLTVANGAPDQARYGAFNLTGTLTGNVAVLWPNATTALFAVLNNTAGAFTLSLGANNGSGSPAGTTVTIAQGNAGLFYSDGTNVGSQVTITAAGLGALAAANNLSDVDSVATTLLNLGIGSMALRNVTIQNGGSPSGGADGDIFFIY